ncbi:inositol monophosphatase family protein [Xenorhabdus sp. Sc-CR9]|uniref:inositol monophosphatase family protein n=1 Tax=Xenorhabdus sp. Sc-CR9 TaxID=2584468 RepID=UPI001F346382|nr:inositol monophosphatase family protein [Xenorhabdus sp. Sc-CR9]
MKRELNLAKLLSLVKNVATSASNLIEKNKSEAQFSEKLDHSVISNIDILAEEYIRDSLMQLTPDIPVYGEELNPEGFDDVDRFWLIDPIDGTSWFKLDIPVYGSLIALIENNEPILGTVAIPGLNQLMYAAKGEGCFYTDSYNDVKLLNSESSKSISAATITSSGIHGTSTWLENGATPWELIEIIKIAKSFKFSGDCIQHLSVARGKVDLAIDTIMKPWDSAALIVCLKEAGMTVMDLYGNTDNLIQSNCLLSANSLELAHSVIEKLKS